MSKLCLLLILAAVSVATTADFRCVAPPQWEARMLEEGPKSERFAKVSYDFLNSRTRIIEEVLSNGDPSREYYDEIFLHEEQRGYRINLKTNECENFTLKEPFREFGIPPEAVLMGEVQLGSGAFPGAGVLIHVYGGETSRGRYAGEWIIMEYQTCLPVSDEFYSRTTRHMSHINFYDITLGISNPNHFVPPASCK